jgi:membrane-associated phospholipid phosphatase
MPQVKRAVQKKASALERADRKVARATGSKHDTPVVKTLGTISDLADQPPLIAISIATIGAGLVLRDSRLARSGVRMLASHWLATAIKSTIKHRIDRTRPAVILKGGSYHARKGTSHAKPENSFPSGHTAGAVAVARAVSRDYPDAAPVAYSAATAAAAVQLPRAAHFASDVLVGGLIGLVAEALIAFVLPADAPLRATGEGRSEPLEPVRRS